MKMFMKDTLMERSLLSFLDNDFVSHVGANVYTQFFFFVGEQEVHLCLIKLTLHILFPFYYFLEVAVKNLQSLYNDFLNTFVYLKFRNL